MSSAGLMGWNVKEKRWHKKHQKRPYAVGCPTLAKMYPNLYVGPTKEGSRAAANQWWREKLVELVLESQQDRRPHADYWQAERNGHKARHAWYADQGDEMGQNDEQQQIESVELILSRPSLPDPLEAYGDSPSTIPGTYKSTALDAELWADRLARNVKPSQQHSIVALVTLFLKTRESDCRPDRIYNLSAHLAHFTGWTDNDDIRKVNGLTLVNFRTHILGKVGRSRANNVMSTVKRFMWWCYEIEAIDKHPRNLKSRDLTISVPPQTVKVWSHQQLKLLFSNVGLTGSPNRHRLWYLLSINVGIQATEIALLSNHEEGPRDDAYYSRPRLDWDRGTITRKRAKTSAYSGVPVVCTKLWPETLDLLRKLGSRDGLVLRGSTGKPLVSHLGQPKRVDTVGTEFRRLRIRIRKIHKKDLPPIKTLRHTAASELDNHKEFGRYEPFFLGHSPRGMSSKHYVVPSQEQFNKAIEFLRSRFMSVITTQGVTPPPARSHERVIRGR
jgi:hypothetical protein